MISVMMSNNEGNNSNRLELDQRNDAVHDGASNDLSRCLVNGVEGDDENRERVRDSIGSEEARVSMQSNDSDNNRDGSLVVDFRGSDEARVSMEVDEEIEEMENTDEKSNVKVDKSSNGDSGEEEMEGKGEDKGKMIVKEVEFQNGKREHKKTSVSDYSSMLSMFDEFADNGNKWTVGYGYEIGDMVWGKVKSHPWWPGHVYDEAFATPSVRRNKTEGHVLVAFFGDSSYGYFDLAELVPFEPNFAEKSKQTSSKSFVKAVEEAIDEVSRRSGLGLACRCRNPYNFRPTSVEGFFVVDVGDYEPAGIFSVSQIKRARESFQPREIVSFLKQVATEPRFNGCESINFIKRKASVLAYRKAVFEEFDETYAQAFGAQPVRPERKTAADLSKEPSRAPLSGRLVIAEALGKGKASGKPAKAKNQVEKDKYLFKRRDEPSKLKSQKTTQGQPGSSSKVVQIDGSTSGKGTHPLVADQVPHTTESNVAGSVVQPLDQSAPMESHGLSANNQMVGDSKLHAAVSRTQTGVGQKKVKVQKRPAGEMSSKDSASVEKKKKRKKDIGMQISSDTTQSPAIAGKVGASVAKVAAKLSQVTSAAEGDPKVSKDLVGNLVQVPSADEGDSKMENQRKDDAASASVLPQLQTVGTSNNKIELRQMLNDLRTVALNPFHGVERSRPQILQKVFLKFRSLVYQKSLVSLVPSDAESSEAHTDKPPALDAVSDSPPPDGKEMLSMKPQKPHSRPADPTIGGRKRGPSDRQEEMAAKKKKKVSDMKSLAADKKAALKAPEAPRADAKDTPVKASVPTLTKAARPEAIKKTAVAVKAPDPTMLILKFPPGGTLPSQAELKAKFARFGPLDPSKIRTYWQSFQCRLVYQHKSHAQAALRFATGNSSPFGNIKVRCFLRDLSVEAPESESAKVQREDASVGASQSREPAVEPRQTPKLASQPPQHPLQLKSILRKPSADEVSSISGGNGGGGGNGNRGARVKFVLGGEESNRIEHLGVGNRNLENNATSFADGGASSSSHANATMDFNSKNFQRVIFQSHQLSGFPPHSTPQQIPTPPPNNMMHYSEGVSRNVPNFNTPLTPPPPPPPPPIHHQPSTANVDIAQQMLSLLTKCNDVVTNLTGFLGYVPYHPL